jgi:putative transposase
MREMIMDHGSEFGAHRAPENGKWDGQFKTHLEKHGIKLILARVKHPQTQWKLEKWSDVYRRLDRILIRCIQLALSSLS